MVVDFPDGSSPAMKMSHLVLLVLAAFAMRRFFPGKPAPKRLRYASGPRYKPDPSKEEMDRAFEDLQDSFQANVTNKKHDKDRWDYAFRVQQLYNLLDFLNENAEEIFEAAKKDIGRTKSEMVLDKSGAIANLQYIVDNLSNWMEPKRVSSPLWMFPSDSYVIREPLGVCLVIGTFNYAIMTSLLPMACAIAAGNAVILKPSELAPEQSKIMARLLPKYLDPSLVRVIEGGADTSRLLVDSYAWGKVFYTGGGKVGALIATSCAARHVPYCLELGGKSPTIIFDDADLGVTCRRVVQGKFVNSGQTCIAPDHIIAVGDDNRYKQVVDALANEIKIQFPGDISKSPSYARMINDGHFKRVKSLLEGGGTVAFGGKTAQDQRFIEPTIMVDVSENDPVMCEEIFGPLLPVLHFRDVDSVLRHLRNKPKPLALYVFGKNKEHTNRIISQTTSGSACVNDTVFQYLNPHLPFGGIGNSGVGAYHGESNFLEFSHQKSVLARSFALDLPIRYLPYLEREWVQQAFAFFLTNT